MKKLNFSEKDKIHLGNIKARRDWGFALDYVKVMWIMLQQDKPDDFVIATGKSHSITEFLEESFEHAGLGNWEKYVEIDKKLFRPLDIDNLVGDSSKAEKILGWKAEMAFKELVHLMVDKDIKNQEK